MRPLRANAVLRVNRAQFMQIIDIDRGNRAQIGHAAHLLRRRQAEMLNRPAMVEARLFGLQFLQRVERQFQPHIAGAMHMHFIAFMPEQSRRLFKTLGHHQPFAFMAVEIAGFADHHQL